MAENNIDIKILFDFPKGIPAITAGTIMNNKKIAVTGHKGGFVAFWSRDYKEPIKKFNLESEIECITVSSENKVLIGCNSGDIYFINPSRKYEYTLIRQGNRDKFSRIWRLKWIDTHSFIATSTFGNVLYFKQTDNGLWNSRQLLAHSNSVFGLDFKEGYLATGDYTGLIVIWKIGNDGFAEIGRITIIGIIQDMKWNNKSSLSAVTRNGHVYYIEFDSQDDLWSVVFDAFVALGNGKSVQFANSGSDLIALTGDELLHINLPSQQIEKQIIEGGVIIYDTFKNSIGVITQNSIVQIKLHDILVPASLVKYRFAKISLIGHTGVGKSTLCDTIIGGKNYEEQSTYGKKVWEWNLTNNKEDRRILFHDHGGQETVMQTYLPFITDSDILMLLFMKNDISTFHKIEISIPRIKNFISDKSKIILVETWIDQKIDEVPKTKIQQLIDASQAKSCMYVSAKNNMGIEELKTELIDEINWDKARVVIQSKESENTMSLISEFQSKQTYLRPFDYVLSKYNEQWGPISTVHLKFLLKNFSSEGIIEYYPEVSNFIIFGGKNYSELRSNIPIFASGNNGIVTITDIEKKFEIYPDYVKIIDHLFLEYRVSIRNGNLRIFPELLRDGDISPSERNIYFQSNTQIVREVENSNIKHEFLIQALSELNLQCIDLTSNQGLFTWDNNAYIYYSFETTGDSIKGKRTKFTFYLSGVKDKYVQRLKASFPSILERLYGPITTECDIPDKVDVKKNKEKYYDIAISYASQQSFYVEKVAELLQNKGIKVFYSPFMQVDMWGEDIDTYLYNTYFSEASTCLMFISKEYDASRWCKLESRTAFERQEKNGFYILPVRFDDTVLPGLDSSLLYLDANHITPEILTDKIVEKLENKFLI